MPKARWAVSQSLEPSNDKGREKNCHPLRFVSLQTMTLRLFLSKKGASRRLDVFKILHSICFVFGASRWSLATAAGVVGELLRLSRWSSPTTLQSRCIATTTVGVSFCFSNDAPLCFLFSRVCGCAKTLGRLSRWRPPTTEVLDPARSGFWLGLDRIVAW